MKKCDQKKEEDATFLARALFRQIESRDKQCAFWILSAMIKLHQDKRTMPCIINIMLQEMAKSAADYDEYCRTT
jgi:hypothetical protein